ncbi:MAG: type II secretion system minor pseudopilin GspJ [Halioglobus sp.]
MNRRANGFTLIEVLIALAITVFVSSIAYASLSSVISGVESTRAVAQRTYEINRAWSILSRDLRQFAARPVRDEFGEVEPALIGGSAARFHLSFTRSGWHNALGQPRSSLERVNYQLVDQALWRESYTVLDRSGNSEPRRVKLLERVEYFDLSFLGAIEQIELGNDRRSIDTRNWIENWITDTSDPGQVLAPPVAIEIKMQLEDLGELRRLYALPPI